MAVKKGTQNRAISDFVDPKVRVVSIFRPAHGGLFGIFKNSLCLLTVYVCLCGSVFFIVI